jgi:catechol 2,3-dioxygenase-like lactoylglutathione lyase family enzyme
MSGPIEPRERAPRPIDPGVDIGHVHLRTADIDRVRDFYVGVLGFDVIVEGRGVPGWGTTGDVLFLSAGGYHHHLGFNTWKSAGGRSARSPTTAPTSPSTSPIRTATTSSCAGTDRRRSGRVRPTAGWRSPTARSPSRTCWRCRSTLVAMDDASIRERIEQLEDEERRLRADEAAVGERDRDALEADRRRLSEIKVELDQLWDLLRQRRALRRAGEDPDRASMRDARTVERYLS